MSITKLSDIQPDKNNANRGSARGSALIKASLKKYGTGRSIVVDKHGVAIGGNDRQAAVHRFKHYDRNTLKSGGDHH